MECCKKEKVRSGFKLVHGRTGKVFAQQSHWGLGYENVSMKCFLKGHTKCSVAINILQLGDADMLCRWAVGGIGLRNAAEHTALFSVQEARQVGRDRARQGGQERKTGGAVS